MFLRRRGTVLPLRAIGDMLAPLHLHKRFIPMKLLRSGAMVALPSLLQRHWRRKML
jgi:hypothetical protein